MLRGAMDFNLNHLRTFATIAQTGSFMAAAEALGRTQSAISLQVRELETRLGITLFDRSSRPAKLTALGEVVLREAEGLLSGAARIETLSQTAAVTASLTVGAIPSTIPWLIAPALARFKRANPTVSVHLRSSNSRELQEMWTLGHLDAAIIIEPPDSQSKSGFEILKRESYVLITPISMGETDPSRILSRSPYIWFNRSTWSSEPVRELLASRASTLTNEIECDTLDGVVAMVANGLGVSIVPVLTGHAPYSLSVSVRDLPGSRRARNIGVMPHPEPSNPELLESLVSMFNDVGREATDGRA